MSDSPDIKFINAVNEHMNIVHKVCSLYFTREDDRKDACQEMLYQLWKAYPRFRGDAKFSTWMYQVCLNTALTHLKKSRRNNHEAISSPHLLIAAETMDPKEESIKMLYRGIENLSPVNKAIILLYLEDLSYEEIATIIGMTKSNISVRLVRIKRELEKHLKNNR